MTTTPVSSGERPRTSLGTALFPAGDGAATITAMLDDSGAVARLGPAGRLPPACRELVTREVARAVDGVVDVDPLDLLLAGWRHWAALRAAATESLAAPGATRVVDVASHEVSAHYDPVVEVRLDGVPVGELRFDLTVTVVVHAGAVTVADGRIVAVRLGALDVTLALCLAGAPPDTAVRRTARLAELPLVALRPGFPLVDDASVPAQRASEPRTTG